MDFHTGDLYFILLRDHNENFKKYNTKIVADYNFKNAFDLDLIIG